MRHLRRVLATPLFTVIAGALPLAAQSSDTPLQGGGRGVAYALSCGPGEVLIGIAGHTSSAVERVGGICSAIDVDGRWVGGRSPTDPPARGRREGASFERVCPRDQAVKGFQGQFGARVERLEIICQPLVAGGRTGGATRTLPGVGGSAGAARGPYYCEAQIPAHSLILLGRDQVDAVGLRCAYPTIGFGWFGVITTSNTTEPVGMRLGSAADVIAGHSIRQIVTDPDVKVRADNVACQTCHTGFGSPGNFNAAVLDRSGFCNLVPAFEAADKSQILKSLFNDWRARGCPD